MIDIKHRSTGSIIKSIYADTLVGEDLTLAKLPCAELGHMDMKWIDLALADLMGANFRCSNMEGAKLEFADMESSDLSFANLRNANLGGAFLRNANMRGVDLRGTCMTGADLKYANIRYVLGDGKIIKTIIDQYMIVIMPEYGVMAIGCEQHSINTWMTFPDERIHKMDANALRWWKEWKPRIQSWVNNDR
jgi:hypothetical protein